MIKQLGLKWIKSRIDDAIKNDLWSFLYMFKFICWSTKSAFSTARAIFDYELILNNVFYGEPNQMTKSRIWDFSHTYHVFNIIQQCESLLLTKYVLISYNFSCKIFNQMNSSKESIWVSLQLKQFSCERWLVIICHIWKR